MRQRIAIVALGVASVFGVATAQPAKIKSTAAGDVLAAPGGETLYVFDGDAVKFGPNGKSSCTGVCAQQWPPFSAGIDAQPMGNWSILLRENGSRQWSYKGRPLYTLTGDAGPGQTNGDGFDGNKWHIAKP